MPQLDLIIYFHTIFWLGFSFFFFYLISFFFFRKLIRTIKSRFFLNYYQTFFLNSTLFVLTYTFINCFSFFFFSFIYSLFNVS